MRRLAALTVLCGVAAIACDARPVPQPVVVYVSPPRDTELAGLFSRFTDETGIAVRMKVGGSADNTDAVISSKGEPPADVLLTSTVVDIWRVAEEGGLRPLSGAAVDRMPPNLRDPDRLWAALAVRGAMIGVSPDADASRVITYRDLADSEFRGTVCLSSATLSVNRSLVGMLIEDLGVKPAEHVVRAWVRNLGRAPFPTEAELVDALRSGTCRYGIFSASIESDGVFRVMPNPLYVDADGIGVSRHASQAASAQALVDWLLHEKALSNSFAYDGRNIGVTGWHSEEAALLAERAGYR